MKTIHLACLSLVLVGCGLGAKPDAVARQYLELGAADDLEGVKALVQSDCTDSDVLEVGAVRMLGIPMQIDTLEVEVASQEGGHAVVDYTVTGSLEGTDGQGEARGLKIHVSELSVGSMTKSGSVVMVKEGMSWKVACP
jgi:hypothetical protein